MAGGGGGGRKFLQNVPLGPGLFGTFFEKGQFKYENEGKFE